MARRSVVFPFSAIIGQDLLKKALILNVIDPNIGGVLIRGERGTAKSTAVRALAQLLPEKEVPEGCPFGCSTAEEKADCPFCSSNPDAPIVKRPMRVVELPVSATEDKVVGTIDITAAIKEGKKKYEPGILAEANGNILYVDEVNLLNDHIVDVLLDVAAMGVNTVEREGISYSHPSRFALVGTMNPEEGDLRPQLLDRFGLCVNIEGIHDSKSRIEIAKRRRDFMRDPAGFYYEWKSRDEKITESIIQAKKILPKVRISDEMMEEAVNKCIQYNVDGHRADIAIVTTACAIAALANRLDVIKDDVDLAAVLVLAHRAQDPPQYQPPQDEENEEQDHDDTEQDNDSRDDGSDTQHEPQRGDGGEPNQTVSMEAGKEFAVKRDVLSPKLRIDDVVRESSGRSKETVSDTGRYTGYRMPEGKPTSIAIDATVRAAAANSTDGHLHIRTEDIREKIRTRKSGNLIVFDVDASGSMGAERRMSLVKSAILSLLTDAYQKRDRVCLVTFRGKDAEIVVPPTNSTDLAKERMRNVEIGGRTPISAGLVKSMEIIRRETFKDRSLRPILVIVSDGRANSGMVKDELDNLCASIAQEDIDTVVLDSESGFIKLGMAKHLSESLCARYMELESIRL